MSIIFDQSNRFITNRRRLFSVKLIDTSIRNRYKHTTTRGERRLGPGNIGLERIKLNWDFCCFVKFLGCVLQPPRLLIWRQPNDVLLLSTLAREALPLSSELLDEPVNRLSRGHLDNCDNYLTQLGNFAYSESTLILWSVCWVQYPVNCVASSRMGGLDLSISRQH